MGLDLLYGILFSTHLIIGRNTLFYYQYINTTVGTGRLVVVANIGRVDHRALTSHTLFYYQYINTTVGTGRLVVVANIGRVDHRALTSHTLLSHHTLLLYLRYSIYSICLLDLLNLVPSCNHRLFPSFFAGLHLGYPNRIKTIEALTERLHEFLEWLQQLVIHGYGEIEPRPPHASLAGDPVKISVKFYLAQSNNLN